MSGQLVGIHRVGMSPKRHLRLFVTKQRRNGFHIDPFRNQPGCAPISFLRRATE